MTYTSSARYAVLLMAALLSGTPDGMVRKIRVTGRPEPKEAVVVLLNVGKDCKESRVERLNASGELELRSESIGACWACGAEMAANPRLAVFSRGNAAAMLKGSEVCDLVKRSDPTIQLLARQTIEFDVWIPANPDPKAVEARIEEARDEFANADWLLNRNMVGVALKPKFRVVDRKTLPVDCSFLRDALDEGRSDLSYNAEGLNVYFVGDRNADCGGEKGVIVKGLFVQDGNALGDLAHEIGHRLGLKELIGIDGTYKNGHTNNVPGFDCLNTMWEKSAIPDNEITIGQAFWMGLSCESAAGRKNCIPCAPTRGGPPCVPFSLTAPPARGQTRAGCTPCTERASTNIRRQVPAAALLPVNLVGEKFQLCTLGEVKRKIEARYDELFKHTKSLPEVRLGTPDKAKFLDRWAKAGIAVLAIDLASKEKDLVKREEWLKHLGGQLQNPQVWDSSKAGNAYLSYGLDLLKRNEPIQRCVGGGPNGTYGTYQ